MRNYFHIFMYWKYHSLESLAKYAQPGSTSSCKNAHRLGEIESFEKHFTLHFTSMDSNTADKEYPETFIFKFSLKNIKISFP